MKETNNKVHRTIKENTKELHPNGEKRLITLTGITTSQINQALKADNPYPARVFLKTDNQEQDIP
ncbi:12282_t:CDS:2 [Entrophospora sp. SA101]|nr:12282_t:CDS:2 [Entrophospora sp. SA101]